MSRVLKALTTGVVLFGIADLPQPQSAQAAPKPANDGKAVPAAVAAGTELIGQFGTWGAYVGKSHGGKVCFALAKPSSSKSNPPRPRDPAYAFVSTRPAERVTNEVYVMIGYTLRQGSPSTLEVGGGAYAMYAQGDAIWIKNAAEERRMVEAMRRSPNFVVKGTSAKGVEITDTFSLKGLAQALDRISTDCRR